MSRLKTKVGDALPFATVEPGLDGIDHYGGERDFLIERVLAHALVKLDWEVNRGLAEALTVLGADARLFLGSTTTGASCAECGNRRRRELGSTLDCLERRLCFARDRMNGGRWLGDDLGVG